MTTAIIITFCILLLIAYLFDLTSSKTRIPSVILLLLLGWGVKQITNWSNIHVPDLKGALPVLGTIGLILIVLEGSLEIEFSKSKVNLIAKSFIGALFPMLILVFLLTALYMHFLGIPFKDSMINAIPFSIISSAIAIPSVRRLQSSTKEFVIYESSFSDILGVLLFNFVALNDNINLQSFGNFSMQLLIILVISVIATIGLSLLLSRINHHIKYFPIILIIVLIYGISKYYHLPGLIIIMTFGLFIGNLDELKLYKWIARLKPDELNIEVKKFKELTTEATFMVRSIFFLLFGFLIESSEILNTDTLIWSVGIVFAIFVFRYIQLKISRLPLTPLWFIAPRGLITILLFLSIPTGHSISIVNKSTVIQVIVITSLVMMTGIMKVKTESMKD